MTTSGLLLSTAAFKSLSPNAQNEVLASIGLAEVELSGRPALPATTAAAAQPIEGNDGPVELTVAMVRRLAANLSDKTLNALRVIAQNDGPQFHMKDVIEATSGAETYMDMRGVWSALTRRTRNIMDDGAADLIWWIGESILDEDGNYVDHIGLVSPMTYSSLRAHFGL
ncbi:MAG TPA: hypothetical protein VGF77_02725 [Allosphingosinicella sp.]|jgi:hypothetical protein